MTTPFEASNFSQPPNYVERRMFDQSVFQTGEFFENVGSDNTKKVVVENPASSDKVLMVFEPRFSGTSQIEAQIVLNVIVDSEGGATTTGITNNSSKDGSSVASAFVAGDNENGAVSGGDQLPVQVAGGGRGSLDPGTVSAAGLTNLVFPGDNISLNLTNSDGSKNSCSIKVQFMQVEEGKLSSINPSI